MFSRNIFLQFFFKKVSKELTFPQTKLKLHKRRSAHLSKLGKQKMFSKRETVVKKYFKTNFFTK